MAATLSGRLMRGALAGLLLVAVSAQGQPSPYLLATFGSDRLRVPGGCERLAISPNGRVLAALTRESLFVFDLREGRLLKRFGSVGLQKDTLAVDDLGSVRGL